MVDEKKPKHFFSPQEALAGVPKVPLTEEQQKARDAEDDRNRARLFAFLEEAKHVLTDEAFIDMVRVLGDLANPDQELFVGLRNAYFDYSEPPATPETAPS